MWKKAFVLVVVANGVSLRGGLISNANTIFLEHHCILFPINVDTIENHEHQEFIFFIETISYLRTKDYLEERLLECKREIQEWKNIGW